MVKELTNEFQKWCNMKICEWLRRVLIEEGIIDNVPFLNISDIAALIQEKELKLEISNIDNETTYTLKKGNEILGQCNFTFDNNNCCFMQTEKVRK